MTLDDSGSTTASGPLPVREVSDARTLRALAHPVRIAVAETLLLAGPLTATEVGNRIGESPTTCSFHLRQLARYGFVEEAGGGKGRARPWRLTAVGVNLSSGQNDPEADLALSALAGMLRERNLGRYRRWLESRAAYPRAWRDAAGESELVLFVTSQELQSLTDELVEQLLGRFGDRLTDPAKRPRGSVPVEMLVFSYPIDHPGAGPDGAE